MEEATAKKLESNTPTTTPTTTSTVETGTDNQTAPQDASANQRSMWQIFTDESGEVQRKSMKIIENPFANEQPEDNPFTNDQFSQNQTEFKNPEAMMSPGIQKDIITTNAANGVLTSVSTHSTAVTAKSVPTPLQSKPPLKPKRTPITEANSNGSVKNSTNYSRVSMTEDTVVFEADTTYTKFDTVDYQDEDEEEIVTNEKHYAGKKFLIRTESDLDLVLPSGAKPSLATRLRWCCANYDHWPKFKVVLKASIIGLTMCLSYALVVVLVVKLMD